MIPPMLFSKKLSNNLILHLCILTVLFLISFVINKIPNGSLIAGGDFYQLVNINDNLHRYLFTWFNQIGQGQYNPIIVAFPFYAFQAILYRIGFTYANIANAVMFFFFVSSFYSFYFSVKIIDRNVPNNIRLLGSAIYAINIFTFTIFTYSWWITHHFLVYIFIPLLFAGFERVILSDSRKDIAFYSILFLISTLGFNNIAYLVALFFIQVLILIAFIVTNKIQPTLNSAKRIIFIFLLQILLSIYFVFPFYISHFEFISKVMAGNVLGDFTNWLSITSTNIYSVFSITMLDDKFPNINLYSDSNIFLAISIGYTIILIALLLNQNLNQKRSWFHYLLFLIPYWFLLMRLTPPFDQINLKIYTLPGFNLFRSPEKLFVFYPFFYLILVSLLLLHSKFSPRLKSLTLIMIFLIPFPFFVGGIPTYLAHGDQAGYSYDIQIPAEYYEVNEKIHDDYRQLSIISLPYSVINSINWANYPKWKFVGVDILHLLFNKLYISANVYDHVGVEQNLSFKEYNEGNNVNREEFVDLIQKFSGQYILVHKDISKYWQDNSKTVLKTIEELELDNSIYKLDDNDYFTFYKLDESLLVPLIEAYHSEVVFQKINPTKYRINIRNITNNTKLDFHQSYNSQWKLYLNTYPSNSWCTQYVYYDNFGVTECESSIRMTGFGDLSYIAEKPIFEDSHIIIDDYANSWTIDPNYIKSNYSEDYYKEDLDGSIEINMDLVFTPQSYFILGLIFSGFILIGSMGYLLWKSFR